MNRIAPATAALFTLLSGAAVLTDAAGSCALPANTPVASSAQESPDPVREMMAREVGTWDLSITDYLDGKAQPSRTGTEVCTLPSTGEWLLSDWTMQRPPGPPIWMHVVLGYSPGTRRWHGSLVDSFGGRMALLEGEAGEEPTVRVLSEGFEHEPYGRTTTRWVGDDERITTFEAKQGDEWVRTCEIVHRRRGPK